MAYELKTFNGTGADCSGSSGDSNRVLTLSNIRITKQDGFLVYASGLPLGLSTDYTVIHQTASTTITFLNGLWDDMTVIVNYYEAQPIGVVSDFVRGPFEDFGVIATRTPVTVTTDYSGNKTYEDGTDEDINITISPYKAKYDLDKSGLNKSYDAMAFVGPDETLNKYDKITHDSKVYRVDSVSIRRFSATSMFKRVLLFFVEDE